MTALDLKWLHASFAVRICVDRVYLGGVWNNMDRRGAAGSVLNTLVDGVVFSIGDGTTLGDVSVVRIGDGLLVVMWSGRR